MNNALIFVLVFGFIGASFGIYTAFFLDREDKKAKEEALKKKFFIED